jgi:quercetin dioxygenase-like cupin family protein
MAEAAEPKYIRYAKDVPAVSVAEWDAGGKAMSATGKAQIAKAPKSAAVYSVKTVVWPTATVRVYDFTKAGGIRHAITDETAIYVIKGSIKAMVGNTTAVLRAGDVASRASGVLQAGDVAEDTSIVTWTAGPVSTEPPIPTVVRADATTNTGSPVLVIIKRYIFPGNSVRHATMTAGAKQPPNTGPADNYMYFLAGHVEFTQGGETYQVRAGDFLRQESGTLHHWDQKDGAVFVASSALLVGKAAMRPGEAFSSFTDHKIVDDPNK